MVFRSREVRQTSGRRESEPQRREWTKYSTGFGEEEAVRVVGNGEGGTKREWNPATR
jgi:hypothetical protein